MGKKRISKRVRDGAILVCQTVASSASDCLYYDVAASWLGFQPYGPERSLAVSAWNYVLKMERTKGAASWTRETDAEAEALLRTGWSPS